MLTASGDKSGTVLRKEFHVALNPGMCYRLICIKSLFRLTTTGRLTTLSSGCTVVLFFAAPRFIVKVVRIMSCEAVVSLDHFSNEDGLYFTIARLSVSIFMLVLTATLFNYYLQCNVRCIIVVSSMLATKHYQLPVHTV
jgi:hypothetical protein